MNTAVVILNYNDAPRTEALVRKIRDYRSIGHIAVVDNCSPDGSFEKLLPLACEKVDVLKAPENGGYARGNNFGILHCLKSYAPEVICVANPDVSFSDETVSALAEALMKNPDLGAVSPLVEKGYNAWNLPGFIGILESLFLFWFNLDKLRIRRKILSDSREIVPVGAIEGSFLAISAEAYKKARGFDERTFLYGEEILFARRLKKAGFHEAVLRDHRYVHEHSASIRKEYRSSKAAAFHHFRDSFRVYNRAWLHTGPLRSLIFDAAWGLGYLERKLYDFVLRLPLS